MPGWYVYNVKNTDMTQMYALKRMWRDESRPSNLPDGSPVVHCSLSTHIKWSRTAYPRDDTLNAIRRGITAKPKDLEPGQDVNRKKKLANDVNVNDQRVHISVVNGRNFPISKGYTPQARNRTYTLMTTHGPVIKHFNDGPLLARAMRDAIEGHRDLWFSGVLHRDINPDNMIITPETKDGKVRCLTDLNHGKKFETRIEFPAAETDDYEDVLSFIKKRLGLAVVEDTTLKLLAYFEPLEALRFLKEARLVWENIPDYIIPEPDSDPRRRSWPDTDDGSKDAMMRTGTLSFMSGELIAPAISTYSDRFGRNTVVQGVIHDIESFFWVLVYLCLTRTGKGRWRDELLKDPPEDDVAKKILHNIVYCLFDASAEDVLKANKTALFTMPDHMEEHIVKAFHPDLICLQPLVLSWWKLLVFSYRTYNDLTPGVIHAQVLKLFDEELKGIRQQFEAQTLDVARSSSDSQPASASEGRIGDGSRTTAPEFNIRSPRPKATRSSRLYNGDPPPDPFDVVSGANTRSNTGSPTPAPNRARLGDN
ncbi:hypothetical protein PUNSTDRAFT_137788 [Punctularia strigosozonata HHB-11173 SS5]|uniref:Fungal-type protein kinase domain-containing protein n=1 Tax=Punctularia strigosozonata (strain HHB-11173) TaxID=741275 RepID=R7S5B6_PUNST|nr:uncharacterized protein PUNSTDRAFT_137788 [Punctularia strigosozonata HHB-11173 SS5]EIN05102.1 hypothetical protein PUNSTDRAFT_137788 [Punctularia strigosozonata HHB-11173 SS5]